MKKLRRIVNVIGLNAVAILIDMAKWTWEVLMRTETTLQTESLPLRFMIWITQQPVMDNSNNLFNPKCLIMIILN